MGVRLTIPKIRGLVRSFGIVALFLAAAFFGTATGVLFAFVDDLPEISALDDYSPGVITRVLARDGSVVGEFATERRQLVTFEEIPEVLRHAIMAAEDGDFMTHGGLKADRMILAAVKDVVTRRNTPGRSTITQQLSRQLFPESVGFERSWTRKAKEALVALQIEKRYTKSEIFTMYCNKVAWGNRAFGVRGRLAALFRQAREGSDVGRGGDDCGHPSGAATAEPLRQYRERHLPSQLHAGPYAGAGLHHR